MAAAFGVAGQDDREAKEARVIQEKVIFARTVAKDTMSLEHRLNERLLGVLNGEIHAPLLPLKSHWQQVWTGFEEEFRSYGRYQTESAEGVSSYLTKLEEALLPVLTHLEQWQDSADLHTALLERQNQLEAACDAHTLEESDVTDQWDERITELRRVTELGCLILRSDHRILQETVKGDLLRVSEELRAANGSELSRLLDVRTSEGFSPLHLAVLAPSNERLQGTEGVSRATALATMLVACGADVNARLRDPSVDTNGVTPLHLAAGMGRLHCVELLLHYHADVHAKDHRGMASLHLAAIGGHEQVVTRLIDAKADVNVQTPGLNRRRTPLAMAISRCTDETAAAGVVRVPLTYLTQPT
mmetsp:Transcript_21207/g.50293  ORF Transcript_21207/g.50293 Transcript_21207/m.50293 type:complete len:359 (+) Transcript_21207:58-1134(+)